MLNDQENPELDQDDVNLEDAFNTIVKLARNAKLTYNEHMIVDRSVRAVHRALNRPAGTLHKDITASSVQVPSKDASQEE